MGGFAEGDSMYIEQTEADTLRMIEKYLLNPELVIIPALGVTDKYKIAYNRDNINFTNMALSTYRGRINKNKISYRLLYENAIMLMRVDTCDATPHINPDRLITIEPYQPHLHIYREGYGDKFAYPLPTEFSGSSNIVTLLQEFLSYSNVININNVKIFKEEVLNDDWV